MEKGYVKLVVIILAGLFMLAILFFLSGMIPSIGAGIRDWLMKLLGLWKVSRFEEAVMCAYYRCVEGCKSTKIVHLLDGKCVKEFCEEVPSEFKEQGRICGYNSRAYPVELEGFSSDKKFTKDVFDPKFSCVIPDNSDMGPKWYHWVEAGMLGPWAPVWYIANEWGGRTHLIVNHTFVSNSEPETCRHGAFSDSKAYKEFYIKSNRPLYFFASSSSWYFNIARRDTVEVQTSPLYLFLDNYSKPNDSGNWSLNQRSPSRIVVKTGRDSDDVYDYIFNMTYDCANDWITVTAREYPLNVYETKTFKNVGDEKDILDFRVKLLEKHPFCEDIIIHTVTWKFRTGAGKFKITVS